MEARRSPWEFPNGWLKPVGSDLRSQAHRWEEIYNFYQRDTPMDQEADWARRRGVYDWEPYDPYDGRPLILRRWLRGLYSGLLFQFDPRPEYYCPSYPYSQPLRFVLPDFYPHVQYVSGCLERPSAEPEVDEQSTDAMSADSEDYSYKRDVICTRMMVRTDIDPDWRERYGYDDHCEQGNCVCDDCLDRSQHCWCNNCEWLRWEPGYADVTVGDDGNLAYIDWAWPLNECARIVDVSGMDDHNKYGRVHDVVQAAQFRARGKSHDTVASDVDDYRQHVLGWGGERFPPVPEEFPVDSSPEGYYIRLYLPG